MITNKTFLLGGLAGLIACQSAIAVLQTGEPKKTPIFFLENAETDPKYENLPEFYSSNADYDEFLNEYYRLHLSVDEKGVYWKPYPVSGAINMLWCVEWDSLFFPWVDRGAMGLVRQNGDNKDVALSTLSEVVVDKYGYVWGANLEPDPKNIVEGHRPKFNWPWPNYRNNSTVEVKTGWEFNSPDEQLMGKYETADFLMEPEPVDFSLKGTVTGPNPSVSMPKIDVEAFQVPIIEIDITYAHKNGQSMADLINGLEVWWTTKSHPRFSEARSVGVDFSVLPPSQFPNMYQPWLREKESRYYLVFPMHLHPEWGRGENRITGLKLVMGGGDAEKVDIGLNFFRATYDVRNGTFNSVLISGTHHFFMWTGNEKFLRHMMPRLRRSMLFLTHHLEGRKDHLLNLEWMVGHDGLGGDQDGHGMIGSYWDLLPVGQYDAETSMNYYEALKNMASLERAVRRRNIKVPPVNVVGPDNGKLIPYRETPESLEQLAEQVKKRFEKTFWMPDTERFCRNVDVNGKKHDYGFLHMNLHALSMGLGTESQRERIMQWVTGERIVEGDTSTGNDIYRWKFSPRTSTRRNESYYFWPWVQGMTTSRKNPDLAPRIEWGNQVQDGGAVPFTSYLDMLARTHGADQSAVDGAYERSLQIKEWFGWVKSAQGQGPQFYRSYYASNPAILQSPQPGGLGLDREFLSDGSLGTLFPLTAFLGIHAESDGVLTIAPAIPSALDKLGVKNVYYHGQHVQIEAGRNYVDIRGESFPEQGLRAKVRMGPAGSNATVYVNGKLENSQRIGDFLWVTTDLEPGRIELR